MGWPKNTTGPIISRGARLVLSKLGSLGCIEAQHGLGGSLHTFGTTDAVRSLVCMSFFSSVLNEGKQLKQDCPPFFFSSPAWSTCKQMKRSRLSKAKPNPRERKIRIYIYACCMASTYVPWPFSLPLLFLVEKKNRGSCCSIYYSRHMHASFDATIIVLFLAVLTLLAFSLLQHVHRKQDKRALQMNTSS